MLQVAAPPGSSFQVFSPFPMAFFNNRYRLIKIIYARRQGGGKDKHHIGHRNNSEQQGTNHGLPIFAMETVVCPLLLSLPQKCSEGIERAEYFIAIVAGYFCDLLKCFFGQNITQWQFIYLKKTLSQGLYLLANTPFCRINHVRLPYRVNIMFLSTSILPYE